MILFYPKFGVDFFIFIPIFWFILYLYAYFYQHNKNIIMLMRMIVLGTISIFVITVSFIYTIYPILCFEKGKYSSVEGYVENFTPRSANGHSMESFSINGVKFEYSEGIIKPGYRKTFYHNGVIKGNGQLLRISYISMDSDNIILCIQQPPFEDKPENKISFVRQFLGVILLICCLFVVFKINGYCSRRRIRIIYDKSFIKKFIIEENNVIIQCTIVFDNTLKKTEKVELVGDFKQYKRKQIILDSKLIGENFDNAKKYFDIPEGRNKVVVNFRGKYNNNCILSDMETICFLLPKIKIKLIK